MKTRCSSSKWRHSPYLVNSYANYNMYTMTRGLTSSCSGTLPSRPSSSRPQYTTLISALTNRRGMLLTVNMSKIMFPKKKNVAVLLGLYKMCAGIKLSKWVKGNRIFLKIKNNLPKLLYFLI